MIRFSGSVLFIDNNCLVYLFDELYYSNRNHLLQAIAILNAEFDEIWIPKTVKKEFLLKRSDKRRDGLLKKAMDNFSAFRICPINVSKNEIVSIVGNTEEDAGEADALLQMNKGRQSENHNISKMTFFSQDKEAIRLLLDQGHNTLDYDDFKTRLFETGIILP